MTSWTPAGEKSLAARESENDEKGESQWKHENIAKRSDKCETPNDNQKTYQLQSGNKQMETL